MSKEERNGVGRDRKEFLLLGNRSDGVQKNMRTTKLGSYRCNHYLACCWQELSDIIVILLNIVIRRIKAFSSVNFVLA